MPAWKANSTRPRHSLEERLALWVKAMLSDDWAHSRDLLVVEFPICPYRSNVEKDSFVTEMKFGMNDFCSPTSMDKWRIGTFD